MHFHILSYYDERFRKLGDRTSEVANNYAVRWNYSFYACRASLTDNAQHVYWKKIELLLDAVQNSSADYILWLDSDALIVGDVPLTSFVTEKPLVISKDVDGICCGVMLAKKCDWTINLLRSWLFLGDVNEHECNRYEARNLRDQTTLKCLMRNFRSVSNQIGTISESVVLHPKARFVSNPLIMHYWSSSGHITGILRAIEKFQEHGWNRECFYDWAIRTF